METGGSLKEQFLIYVDHFKNSVTVCGPTMGGGVFSSASAMVSANLGRLVAGVTTSLSDVPRFNGCVLVVEADTCESGGISFTFRFLGIEGFYIFS